MINQKNSDQILSAYAYCQQITRNHYENFPVASLLLPNHLRIPIAVIYAFGRSADDIADEGNRTAEERLQALSLYEQYLFDDFRHCERSEAIQEKYLTLDCFASLAMTRKQDKRNFKPKGHVQNNPTKLIFIALHSIIKQYQLPLSLFSDLLSAFKQDLHLNEYQTLAELKDYCRRSASSIGKLLLHLSHLASEQNLFYADCICTAIQLINFLQDLKSDLDLRDRCYLPKDILQQFGLTKADLKKETEFCPVADLNSVIHVMLTEIQRLLIQGNPLAKIIKGRLGFELKLTLVCAYKMIDKLKQRKHPFIRPKLRLWDWPTLLLKTLFYENKFFQISSHFQKRETEC